MRQRVIEYEMQLIFSQRYIIVVESYSFFWHHLAIFFYAPMTYCHG